MSTVRAALFVLSALCFRHALALSTGAPDSVCTTLTQQHPGLTAGPCPNCMFNVSLVAIGGSDVEPTAMYRCGLQHTFQVETSGPAFRGLAVQVRDATGSEAFSNDAAFVGEFVNAPAGGDWRIWNCAAASATHTSNSDKTAVNITWQAPGGPTTSDVTVWYAITQNFVTLFSQLRGPTLSPDPAFCGGMVATTMPEPTTPEATTSLGTTMLMPSPTVLPPQSTVSGDTMTDSGLRLFASILPVVMIAFTVLAALQF